MNTAFPVTVLAGFLALATPASATINADFASNYSGGWTNASNGGAGFGAWTLSAVNGSGPATNGIWNSAEAGLEMGDAFGYGAWGDGSSIRISRAFSQGLTNGNVFAFDLGLNEDPGTGGNRGFVLRTADNRDIITVNQGATNLVTVNGVTALTNYGTTTMHWTITQVSGTQIRVYATGRSGSEAITILVTNTATSYLSSFLFYATNLVDDANAALRGIYFDNLVLNQATATTNFTYTVDSSLTTITGISTNVTGDVVIPSTLGGYAVVAIDRSAFKDNTNITSLVFASGDTVTNIGVTAFQGCTRLTFVALPTALTSISDGLFSGCASLVSVTIPAGVTNIGSQAFAGCRSLPSVALPSGLKMLGESAFLNCRTLAAIDFPDNPKSLPGQSCYECRALASVDFAAGLTNIGYSAFYDCLSLAALTPPSTLATLGADAFNNCSTLTTLTFNSSLSSIGARAFYGCSSLATLFFDGGVGSLGSAAFGNDPLLESVCFTGSQPTVTDSGTDLFAASSVPLVYSLNTSGWSSTLGGATVLPWVPVMSDATMQSGVFSFTVSWANGYQVRVQTCTNLAGGAWSDWSTNVVSGGSCTFSDARTNTQCYYRASGL
ncbi:MAG: leucine-rich repeat domain-containing protein [Verrucomicrobiota bacterium]